MRLALTLTVMAFALLSVSGALAGGSFDRLVGVGAAGHSKIINLNSSGVPGEQQLVGTPSAVPASVAYVRLYPFIGGLPAIPGRFYPRVGVVCFSWHEPASNCTSLSPVGRRLLAPFGRLPLLHQAPTTVVAVDYRSRRLRAADGNIFAAIELALERKYVPRRPASTNGIELTVQWRGPVAATRPRRLALTPLGVVAQGRLYPLPHGAWCFIAGNLTAPSATLLEAQARICR